MTNQPVATDYYHSSILFHLLENPDFPLNFASNQKAIAV
jgi:hypothetical protein